MQEYRWLTFFISNHTNILRAMPPSGSMAFKPVGCNECRGTGYRGRSAIFEIMEVTDAIRELIVNGSSSAVVRDEALRNGLKNLRASGVRKILDGRTSVEEVLTTTF